MQPMRYFRGWVERPPEPAGPGRVVARNAVEVAYSDAPELKMPAIEAQDQCRYLRTLRIRVGPHYCDFSVEELPDGGFAIVCLPHPARQ